MIQQAKVPKLLPIEQLARPLVTLVRPRRAAPREPQPRQIPLATLLPHPDRDHPIEQGRLAIRPATPNEGKPLPQNLWVMSDRHTKWIGPVDLERLRVSV